MKEANPYCLFCGNEIYKTDIVYSCSCGKTFINSQGRKSLDLCPVCMSPKFLGELEILPHVTEVFSFCSNADCPEYRVYLLNINVSGYCVDFMPNLYHKLGVVLQFCRSPFKVWLMNNNYDKFVLPEASKEKNTRLYQFLQDVLKKHCPRFLPHN